MCKRLRRHTASRTSLFLHDLYASVFFAFASNANNDRISLRKLWWKTFMTPLPMASHPSHELKMTARDINNKNNWVSGAVASNRRHRSRQGSRYSSPNDARIGKKNKHAYCVVTISRNVIQSLKTNDRFDTIETIQLYCCCIAKHNNNEDMDIAIFAHSSNSFAVAILRSSHADLHSCPRNVWKALPSTR